MQITAVSRNDIRQCAEAFVASYNEFPWNHKWKLQDAVKYLNEYLDSPQFIGFMIREGDHVAGALFGHAKTWWTGSQLMIDELFIASGRQGKGYGKSLLQHAEQHAKDNGIGLLMLMTNKFMPALRFYDKNDFSKVDQYVFMFKQLLAEEVA